ncbi:MAG: hypothetical protein HYU77_17060 [Betaproteobacteria bacterium]|nr:hypothetical protein [Betaproteobacteria bacterium]
MSLTLLLCGLGFMTGCATPTQLSLDAEVKRLCAIDGGIKVYETVKLPPEKFDKYGVVHVPPKDKVQPTDAFFYEWDIRQIVRGNPKDGKADLARSHFRLYRTAGQKLVGESVAYTRRGGDVPGPWHPSHFTCPADSDLSNLKKRVFVRDSKGGV